MHRTNSDVLAALDAQMQALLAKINRPHPDFTLAREPRDDGTPYVEVADDTLIWNRREQGTLLEHLHATPDEVLFLAMSRFTLHYAQQAEMQARDARGYSRWRWMDAHTRLMAHLNPAWGARLEERYSHELTVNPLHANEMGAALVPLDLRDFGID
ncbi:MAG: hypothetical protein AAGG54_05090 [Pseudomonadota bacterium]